MPLRIQRKRTRGWRMPAGSVYVGRPTKNGNVFRIGLVACGCRSAGECSHNTFRRATAAEAVQAYRDLPRSERRLEEIEQDLRGKDLVCWCHLCDRHKDGKPLGVECKDCAPCHVDPLLEWANR